MPYIGVFVAVIILVALLLFFRKRDSHLAERRADWRSAAESYTIKPTTQMIEEEKLVLERTLQNLKTRMQESGFFKPEWIAELANKVAGDIEVFQRIKGSQSYGGEPFLTVEEKRSLRLNTRMKYSRDFISCFRPEALSAIEPKTFLENLHLAAWHDEQRRKEIRKLKALGIQRLRICPCMAAPPSQSKERAYLIDEVPKLPRENCPKPFCPCFYLAALDK